MSNPRPVDVLRLGLGLGALAALVPTHRRLAPLSAVAATGFAVADLPKEAQ